jgi:hypothetical protein
VIKEEEVKHIIDVIWEMTFSLYGTVSVDKIYRDHIGKQLRLLFPHLPPRGHVKGSSRRFSDMIKWRFQNTRKDANGGKTYKPHMKVDRINLCESAIAFLDNKRFPITVVSEGKLDTKFSHVPLGSPARPPQDQPPPMDLPSDGSDPHSGHKQVSEKPTGPATLSTLTLRKTPKSKKRSKGEQAEKEKGLGGKRKSPLTPETSPQRRPSPSWNDSKVKMEDTLSKRTQPVFTITHTSANLPPLPPSCPLLSFLCALAGFTFHAIWTPPTCPALSAS